MFCSLDRKPSAEKCKIGIYLYESKHGRQQMEGIGWRMITRCLIAVSAMLVHSDLDYERG
jgi:hypothetical protein